MKAQVLENGNLLNRLSLHRNATGTGETIKTPITKHVGLTSLVSELKVKPGDNDPVTMLCCTADVKRDSLTYTEHYIETFQQAVAELGRHALCGLPL